jgi:hypothetical protein
VEEQGRIRRECAFEEVEEQSSTYLTVVVVLVVAAVLVAAAARPTSVVGQSGMNGLAGSRARGE